MEENSLFLSEFMQGKFINISPSIKNDPAMEFSGILIEIPQFSWNFPINLGYSDRSQETPQIPIKQLPPFLSTTLTQISLSSGQGSPKNPIPRQLKSSPQPGVAELQR